MADRKNSTSVFNGFPGFWNPYILLFFTFLFLVFFSCRKKTSEEIVITGQALGSKFSVKYIQTDNGPAASEISVYLKNYFIDFQDKTSLYQDDSELIRINKAPADVPIEISEDIFKMVQYAVGLSEKTNGLYDVTAGSLYRINPSESLETVNPSVPAKRKIVQAILDSGYKKIHFYQKDNRFYFLKTIKNLRLDLSSLAAGYASDQVANYLQSKGITEFLVDVGGEFRARSSGKKKWIIGIENPENEGTMLARVNLSNQGLSTSGNYRTRTFGHILNPVTGQSVQNNLLSVTVIMKTAMEADALATALFVMGFERAKKYSETNSLAVYLAGRDSTNRSVTFQSRNFTSYQAD